MERHFLLVCFYGSAKEQSNYAHGLAQNPSLGNPPFCASVCGKKGATVTQQSTPNLAADVSATGNRGEWRCMVWQRGEYKYRVTKQLEPNLLLTSKQKFRFGQARPGLSVNFVLKSTGGLAQVTWTPCSGEGQISNATRPPFSLSSFSRGEKLFTVYSRVKGRGNLLTFHPRIVRPHRPTVRLAVMRWMGYPNKPAVSLSASIAPPDTSGAVKGLRKHSERQRLPGTPNHGRLPGRRGFWMQVKRRALQHPHFLRAN